MRSIRLVQVLPVPTRREVQLSFHTVGTVAIEIEVVRLDGVAEIGIHLTCERGDICGSFVVWITGEHTKALGEWDDSLIWGTSRKEIIKSALSRDRRVHDGAIGTVADDINV